MAAQDLIMSYVVWVQEPDHLDNRGGKYIVYHFRSLTRSRRQPWSSATWGRFVREVATENIFLSLKGHDACLNIQDLLNASCLYPSTAPYAPLNKATCPQQGKRGAFHLTDTHQFVENLVYADKSRTVSW